MKRISATLTAILLLCFGTFNSAFAANQFRVAVSTDQLAKIQELANQNGGSLANIPNASFAEKLFAERELMEAVIMEKAVKAAGLDAEFVYVPFKDTTESIPALISGQVDAIGYSVDLKSLAPAWANIYITTAVISRGDTQFGFYGRKDNPKFKNVRTEEDVRNLVGMTSSGWAADWASMKGIGIRDVRDGGWPEQVKGVVSGEIDFIIRGFGNAEDFNFEFTKGHADEASYPAAEGVKIYPVDGFKIAFVGSRHFAVSQSTAKGAVLNASLNLGLTRLKKNGDIKQALITQGYINARLEDWTVMIPTEDVVLGIQ